MFDLLLDLFDGEPSGLFGADPFTWANVLLVFPALLLTAWANNRFRRVLQHYVRVASLNGYNGVTAARRVLEFAGVRGVRVVPAAGVCLTDRYDPRSRELILSRGIYTGSSLAAVGVAAHEAGHAVQQAGNYGPLALRTFLVPVTRACYALGFVCVSLGLALSPALLWVGFALFGCCLLFPFVNLPVEVDASARARQLAAEAGVIRPEEEDGLQEVLHAAAWTYVAAALQVALGFLALALLLIPAGGPIRGLLREPDTRYVLLGAFAVAAFFYLYRPARKSAAPAPDARELNAQGNLLAAQGDLAEAVAAFTRALSLDPHFAEAYVNRGATYGRTGQLDEALADLDAAVRLWPRHGQTYLVRGHIRARRNELDEALADYDAALRLDPATAAYVHHSRGRICTARGEHDRAIGYFTEALRQGADRAVTLCDRGLAFYHKGDHDRALADLEESLRLNPQDAVAWNNRGAALLRRGDYARAAADLGTALRLLPDLPNAFKNLAWLQATCPDAAFRDGAAAVANAARALRLSGGQPVEWLAILAAAHAEAGDFAEAVRWQTKCRDESPPAARAEVQSRLDLYEARRPYREPPARRLTVPASVG
jgi:Zn-dependent membrane protease YugP/Flp pilus assembly protein TadD